MVGVVRTGITEGDVLVLTEPSEQVVEGFFTVKKFTKNREVMIEDKDGRLFATEGGRDLWVHPLVLVRFPKENLSRCTKFGYSYQVELHVNDDYRVHNLHYVRSNKLHLFNQLPARIKKGH